MRNLFLIVLVGLLSCGASPTPPPIGEQSTTVQLHCRLEPSAVWTPPEGWKVVAVTGPARCTRREDNNLIVYSSFSTADDEAKETDCKKWLIECVDTNVPTVTLERTFATTETIVIPPLRATCSLNGTDR